MLRIVLFFMLMAIGNGISISTAAAQDAQKKTDSEKIPAPKIVQPTPTIIEPYVIRPGSRDVWQHYGVNSLGRFVPRVINTPYGYYYSRNLEPYPWAMSRSTALRP